MIKGTNQTTIASSLLTAAENDIDAFLKAFEECKERITLNDLRAKSEDGPNKGKSVL